MARRTSGNRRNYAIPPVIQPQEIFGSLGEIYTTAKGRKFGAWIDADSRNQGYNQNDLIENPVFIIESLLRDELGLTSSSINYSSFDNLGDASTGRRDNWLFARSLQRQQNSLEVIDEICQSAGIVAIHDFANQERVVALDHYNPSTQLLNTDVAWENGIPQVRVRQTHVKHIRNEFFLNYKLNYATGNYDKQMFITASATNMVSNVRSDKTYATYTALCSGSQTMYNKVERWTFNSDWIRDDTTAELMIKLYADWLAIRRWEIEATLLYSSKILKLEAFDQVLWVLDLLPISMQDTQVSEVSAVAATSGGSMADGTYYYVVSAVDAHGETKQSAEVSATITGGGGAGKVTISWTALAGATTYNIYGRTAGSQNIYFNTASTSYIDTGAAGTGGTPHTANAAFFITNVLDYSLRGGGRVKMTFQACPYIFF